MIEIPMIDIPALDIGKKLFPPKKLGLALGGGVARGIAHIGVLKVLVQNEIQVDYLAGVSAGALIGAAFAAGVSLAEIEKASIGRWWGHFAKVSLHRKGAASTEGIAKLLRQTIGDIDFSDLKIPLSITALDLMSGERIVFSRGNVADAVRASCSFPGVFVPFKTHNMDLIDGGLLGNVPVEEVRAIGAEKVVAVDVMPDIRLTSEPKNALAVIDRAFTLAMRNVSIPAKKQADLVIEPVTENISLFDLKKAPELIAMGEAATEKALPGIRKLIHPLNF